MDIMYWPGLQEAGEIRCYGPGETVMPTGRPPDCVQVIEDGLARVTAHAGHGEDAFVRASGPGQVLGEELLLPRRAAERPRNRPRWRSQRARPWRSAVRPSSPAFARQRAEQQTAEWKARYNIRAGVEGTISQAVRATRLRRTPYHGQDKTHLASVLSATAINLIRADAWLNGTPIGTTRVSHLVRLDLAA